MANIHPYATRVKKCQFATLSIFLISNFKRKHQNSWVLIEKRKTLSKSHSSRLVNIHIGRASACGGGAEVERRCQIGNVCLEMCRLGWMGHFSQFSISLTRAWDSLNGENYVQANIERVSMMRNRCRWRRKLRCWRHVLWWCCDTHAWHPFSTDGNAFL